jgi:hypothetical protein
VVVSGSRNSFTREGKGLLRIRSYGMGKMRFRRAKSAIIPRQKPKLSIGRPKKEEGEAVTRKIRISGKLLNIILDHREVDSAGSYNETILRMLNRKTQIIIEQSDRIKKLEHEIQQLIPTDTSPSISTSHVDERDSLENISKAFGLTPQGKEWEI